MDPVMDRATLDSFVDGALSPEEAARVVMHLADCPLDAALVDALMETNVLLAAAYSAPLHEPVPERLRAAIFPGAAPVAAHHASRRPVARTGWRLVGSRRRAAALAALAASAALAIGLGFAPDRDPGAPRLLAGTTADDALRSVLETHASGVIPAPAGPTPQITLIATFLDRDGRPCREFEILDTGTAIMTQGVACRGEAAGWVTEFAVASRLSPDPSRGAAFVPAEGASATALDGALDRLGVGLALSPGEEAALIGRGWHG